MGIKNFVTAAAGKCKFFCKEHGPEIDFVLGTIMFIDTCISFYKARPRFEKVLADHKEQMAQQKLAEEKADASQAPDIVYPKAERTSDRRGIYLHTGVDTIKVFALPALKGAVSLGLFGRGFGTLKSRNAGLTQAYTALAMGEGAKKATESGEIVDGEHSEETSVAESEELCVDPIVKTFDKKSAYYSEYPENNRFFLDQKQKYCNMLLHSRGFLFLNEVFDILGIEKTEAGQVLGWKYYRETTDAIKQGSANFIDFGAYTDNGDIYLVFNVDKKPLFGRTGLKKR